MKISLSLDSDGYLSQECPSCYKRFKTTPGKGSDKPISYCPYCGHQGKSCWWTTEQAKYLGTVAARDIAGPELLKITDDFNRKVRGGFLGLKMTTTLPPAVPAPVEPDEFMPVASFPCCGETIKYEPRSQLHCIICGTLTDTQAQPSV